MTWATDMAEMATNHRDGFDKVQVTLRSIPVEGETVNSTTGTRTTAGAVQETVYAWRSDDRHVSRQVSAAETEFNFRAADLPEETFGTPSPGWEIDDPEGATWEVVTIDYEAARQIIVMTCRRKR